MTEQVPSGGNVNPAEQQAEAEVAAVAPQAGALGMAHAVEVVGVSPDAAPDDATAAPQFKFAGGVIDNLPRILAGQTAATAARRLRIKEATQAANPTGSGRPRLGAFAGRKAGLRSPAPASPSMPGENLQDLSGTTEGLKEANATGGEMPPAYEAAASDPSIVEGYATRRPVIPEVPPREQ